MQDLEKRQQEILAEHEKQTKAHIEQEVAKQKAADKKQIDDQTAQHTKSMTDLQQKLSASEQQIKALETEKKSLLDTQQVLNGKVAEMDKMRADLITAEKEASQYKLEYLEKEEKHHKKEHAAEEDHYKKKEKEV